MDHGLPPELEARNSHHRSRSDMRQDGMRYHVPGLQTHNPNINNHIRGQKSLDRFRSQFSGPRFGQYEDYASMNGQLESLVASRARCTALETHSEAAKKRWDELLNRYHQNQLRYEIAIDPYRNDTISSGHASDISTLRDQLDQSGKDLEAQSTRIRQIQQQYQEARTTLDMEFARLPVSSNPQSITSNSAYTHITYATQSDRRPSWQTSASSVPDPMQSRTPDPETLREDYFKWAADVNIYGEQLADHNYEYWTSLADRERRQDQDETLSIPDEEFEADAQQRRQTITKALDEAIDKADRLKNECERLGIDLNPQNRNIWDLEDVALSEAETEARAEYRKTFEAALSLVPPEAFENAELVRASPSEHGSEELDYPAPSERIEDWVETLSPDHDASGQIEEPMASSHA